MIDDLLKISNCYYFLRNSKLLSLMWHGLENNLLKISNFSFLLRNSKLVKSEIVLHCTKQHFKARTILRISKEFFYPSTSHYLELVDNFLMKFNQNLSSIPKKIIT